MVFYSVSACPLYRRETEAEDDKTPSFVAFVELKPVILVYELLSYFDRYRDTTAIKKSLFDRGYSIAIKDANYLNILGIGDERQTNYNESLSLGLSKLEPALIYQTDYEFLFKTWEPWLLSKGFTVAKVAQSNTSGERYFQRGEILVGVAQISNPRGETCYRLFIKKIAYLK